MVIKMLTSTNIPYAQVHSAIICEIHCILHMSPAICNIFVSIHFIPFLLDCSGCSRFFIFLFLFSGFSKSPYTYKRYTLKVNQNIIEVMLLRENEKLSNGSCDDTASERERERELKVTNTYRCKKTLW